MVFLFFFQAEDGIRDWSVTGVQTCALPIYAHGQGAHPAIDEPGGERIDRLSPYLHQAANFFDHVIGPRHGPGDDVGRSEERRVGKEGRSRWAPDREKKEVGYGVRRWRLRGD